MQINKIYIKKEENLSLFTIFILVLAGAFRLIEPYIMFIDNRTTLFMLLLMFLTMINIHLMKLNEKQYFYSFSFILISGLVLILGDIGIPYSTLIAINLVNSNLKKGLKIIFFTGFFLLNVNAFNGLVLGFNSQYNDNDYYGKIRYTLGFDQPNKASTYFIILISIYLIFRKKLNVFDFIFIWSYALFLYKFTLSKTLILSLAALTILYFPIKFILKYKSFHFIVPSAFIIGLIVSFLLGTIFNTQFFNDKLSGRPLYFNWTINNESIAFITKAFVAPPENQYLDNLFLVLIYRISLIVLLLSAFGIYLFFYDYRKYNDIRTLFVLSITYIFLMISSITGDFLTTNFNGVYIALVYSFLLNKNEINGFLNKLAKTIKNSSF